MFHLFNISVINDPLKLEESEYSPGLERVINKEDFLQGFFAELSFPDGSSRYLLGSKEQDWKCFKIIGQGEDGPLFQLEFKHNGTFYQALEHLIIN